MIASLNASGPLNKLNAWASYDYGRNDFDGRFVSGNANIDTVAAGGDLKLSRQLLIGAAFGYSDNDGDFGGGSGGYKLKETTGTAYVGYGDGPWYVGATLGAGHLDYGDIHRTFALGAQNRTESGETRGWHVMGSVLGGYWFNYADWQHGPFVRLAYQEIHVDGFAERGSDSSALLYGEQERKSFISSLGWQVAGQVANVRPFARVSWEIESKDDDRFRVRLVGHPRRHVFDADDQTRQQLRAIPAWRERRLRPRDGLRDGYGNIRSRRRQRLRRHRRHSHSALIRAFGGTRPGPRGAKTCAVKSVLSKATMASRCAVVSAWAARACPRVAPFA